MHDAICITTPSRLHFGLLRFGQDRGPSYGGLGMMLAKPRIAVELQKSDQWHVAGPMADRALAYARNVLQKWQLPPFTAFDIRVLEAPLSHAGLGSGTQLALAVAYGIRSVTELPACKISELVDAVGRGRRSAVGSHGFDQGGILWETGYQPGQSLSPLACRMSVPDVWRVLLITPNHPPGLHGASEATAFDRLPPISEEIACQLERLAEDQVLPAIEQVDFDRFAASIFQYGHLAGRSFSSIQGGPYASPQIAACIDRLRHIGIQGVGQSSWGPTIFAFCMNQDAAEELAERLPQFEEFTGANLSITPPDNQGAAIERIPDFVT